MAAGLDPFKDLVELLGGLEPVVEAVGDEGVGEGVVVGDESGDGGGSLVGSAVQFEE